MNNAAPASTDTARPEVIFDIDFSAGLLFISLRNIGTRPAYSVKTTLSPQFRGLGGTQAVNELPVFTGIEFFAPGKEIRFLLDSAAAWFARREPSIITARLVYSDDRGNSFETAVKHDLEIYKSLAYT